MSDLETLQRANALIKFFNQNRRWMSEGEVQAKTGISNVDRTLGAALSLAPRFKIETKAIDGVVWYRRGRRAKKILIQSPILGSGEPPCLLPQGRRRNSAYQS